MTYKEILIVTYSCSVMGWLFLTIGGSPRIALAFLFAALGGFAWAGIKKKRGSL